MINLKALEESLDNALENSTSESLKSWIRAKRRKYVFRAIRIERQDG